VRDTDKQGFSVAMFWLAKNMPLGRDKNGDPIPRLLEKEFVNVFFDAFRDMPLAKFQAGVKYHFAHSEWFPNVPGTLRKSCEMVPAPRQGWLPPPERVLLPETPRSQAKDNMRKISEMLNKLSGGKSSFEVGEDGTLKPNQGARRGKR